nr:DUF2267 domain-containing protein [Pseudonocardia acidicola]
MTIVQEKARLDRAGTERAVRATLETFSERIAPDRAAELRVLLPAQMRQWITESPILPIDVQQFLRRVGEREGTDLDPAERHTRAVFHGLGALLTPNELAPAARELPQDFRPLFDLAQQDWVEYVPGGAFFRRVAQRAGLDDGGAHKAVDAALETLAERISGGDVDDLIHELSIRLHPPLWRGKEHSRGEPRPMSLDKFLRLLAEREAVPREVAREHARAVMATVREAISGTEFSHVKAQLPSEFEPLLVTG